MEETEMDIDTEMGVFDSKTGSTNGSLIDRHQPHLVLYQQSGAVFGGGNVKDLLEHARQLIDQGKHSVALQAVVMALKLFGGDQAVLQTMNRAREMYLSKIRSVDATDELASLFANCAISEALPMTEEAKRESFFANMNRSVLAESGREQIVLDAYMDGTNFICLQCGGLVSNLRQGEHLAYWCTKSL